MIIYDGYIPMDEWVNKHKELPDWSNRLSLWSGIPYIKELFTLPLRTEWKNPNIHISRKWYVYTFELFFEESTDTLVWDFELEFSFPKKVSWAYIDRLRKEKNIQLSCPTLIPVSSIKSTINNSPAYWTPHFNISLASVNSSIDANDTFKRELDMWCKIVEACNYSSEIAESIIDHYINQLQKEIQLWNCEVDDILDEKIYWEFLDSKKFNLSYAFWWYSARLYDLILTWSEYSKYFEWEVALNSYPKNLEVLKRWVGQVHIIWWSWHWYKDIESMKLLLWIDFLDKKDYVLKEIDWNNSKVINFRETNSMIYLEGQWIYGPEIRRLRDLWIHWWSTDDDKFFSETNSFFVEDDMISFFRNWFGNVSDIWKLPLWTWTVKGLNLKDSRLSFDMKEITNWISLSIPWNTLLNYPLEERKELINSFFENFREKWTMFVHVHIDPVIEKLRNDIVLKRYNTERERKWLSFYLYDRYWISEYSDDWVKNYEIDIAMSESWAVTINLTPLRKFTSQIWANILEYSPWEIYWVATSDKCTDVEFKSMIESCWDILIRWEMTHPDYPYMKTYALAHKDSWIDESREWWWNYDVKFDQSFLKTKPTAAFRGDIASTLSWQSDQYIKKLWPNELYSFFPRGRLISRALMSVAFSDNTISVEQKNNSVQVIVDDWKIELIFSYDNAWKFHSLSCNFFQVLDKERIWTGHVCLNFSSNELIQNLKETWYKKIEEFENLGWCIWDTHVMVAKILRHNYGKNRD